jgi:hypothetical protein
MREMATFRIGIVGLIGTVGLFGSCGSTRTSSAPAHVLLRLDQGSKQRTKEATTWVVEAPGDSTTDAWDIIVIGNELGRLEQPGPPPQYSANADNSISHIDTSATADAGKRSWTVRSRVMYSTFLRPVDGMPGSPNYEPAVRIDVLLLRK